MRHIAGSARSAGADGRGWSVGYPAGDIGRFVAFPGGPIVGGCRIGDAAALDPQLTVARNSWTTKQFTASKRPDSR